MKRSILAAIACSVWLSAAASAAALTYELNRPLLPRTPSTTVVAPPPPLTMATSALAESVPPGVLEMPVITIVGRLATRAAPARTAAPELAHDIGRMNCAGWRELDMGSGRVQLCE
jgi:hypothetical protein